MHPVLYKLPFEIPFFGVVEFPAYFTAATVGFAIAIILVWRWAKRTTGVDPDSILDLGVVVVLGGLLGARILSVLVEGRFWDYVHLCIDPLKVDWPLSKAACMSERYAGIWDPIERVCHPDYRDCFSWLKFWRGGLAFYGGLLVATAAGLIFLKARKLPVLRIADASGWAIPLGLGWGRLGCFFNGCCFGSVAGNSEVGVSFPPGSQVSLAQYRAGQLESQNLPSLPVHPTQLYEAAFSFLIAIICYRIIEPRKRFAGETFLIFIMLYAVARFVEEFWRMDERGGVWGLSTSQLIGIASFVAAAFCYAFTVYVRSGKATPPYTYAKGIDA